MSSALPPSSWTLRPHSLAGTHAFKRWTFQQQLSLTWPSAHRGKWGQLTLWKNGWKIKKRKHAKRAVFWMGVGMKWYEWWLVGLADDYYYCYYYWSLPFFASIPLSLYFTKIPKFIKLLKRTVLRWPHIYSDILQNATFRSQIFKVLFVSGD